MDLWAACRDRAVVTPLSGTLLRVVESQEQVATRALVDSLEEQALLEQLIEASKPPRPPGCEHLDYLLATPFRYPPLRHGSRFGRRDQPSIFYGAARITTALAETAYYRLLFLDGMATPPPGGCLSTQHTAFRARYRCDRGLRLEAPPFDDHRERLRDPARYHDTQALGSAMRAAGIEAFSYRSARDRAGGINLALFGPAALVSRRPTWRQRWLGETRAEAVTFLRRDQPPLRFVREDFLVDGRLPDPAR